MYTELPNKIIKEDKFLFNNAWRSYHIEIGLDDEDYIHIHNDRNSYYTYFKIDEVDTFYTLLDECRDYLEYDEDEDEEYHPDEIDTSQWDWMFNDDFKGNYIIDDTIANVKEAVQQFIVDTKPLSIDGIKSKVNELNSMSLAELQRINKFIQDKAVANE